MNKKFYSLIAAAIVSVSAFAQEGYSLTAKDVKVEKGTAEVALELEMTNVKPITLVQADLFLGKGLSWKRTSAGKVDKKAIAIDETRDPDEEHTFTWTEQTKVETTFDQAYQDKANELVAANGSYAVRLLIMSNDNIAFEGTEGVVATVSNIKVDDPSVDAEYTVDIWTQCLVEPVNAEAFGKGWTKATVTVGDGTGINGIIESADSNAPVYNLNGQRVNKAQKGVFIQNGKKVAKK